MQSWPAWNSLWRQEWSYTQRNTPASRELGLRCAPLHQASFNYLSLWVVWGDKKKNPNKPNQILSLSKLNMPRLWAKAVKNLEHCVLIYKWYVWHTGSVVVQSPFSPLNPQPAQEGHTRTAVNLSWGPGVGVGAPWQVLHFLETRKKPKQQLMWHSCSRPLTASPWLELCQKIIETPIYTGQI